MSSTPVRVYLETTAINHLLLPQHATVKDQLLTSQALSPIVSGVMIAELVATKDAVKRGELLELAHALASRGRIAADKDDVVRDTIKGYVSGDRRRPYRGITARTIRRWFASGMRLNDGDLQAALRGNRDLDEAMNDVVESLKEAGLAPRDERDWIDQAAHSSDTAKRFVSALRNSRPEEPHLSRLAEAVAADEPYVRPLRAAVLCQLGASGMRRLERNTKNPVSGRDMLHGIYLPISDVFVSEDKDQQNLARMVAEHLGNRPRIIRVAEVANL